MSLLQSRFMHNSGFMGSDFAAKSEMVKKNDSEPQMASVLEVKGTAQMMERLRKGRDYSKFKRQMMQRSTFSTADLRKPEALTQTTKHSTIKVGAKRNFRSGFEKDGAQIVPKKNKQVTAKPRPPLHLPKSRNLKLKASTVKDMEERE